MHLRWVRMGGMARPSRGRRERGSGGDQKRVVTRRQGRSTSRLGGTGRRLIGGAHKGVWLDRHVELMAKARTKQGKLSVEVDFCQILFYFIFK